MDARALEHFGLEHDPFAGKLDPCDFHPTRAHSKALEELGSEVRRGTSLIVFQAPDGAGKTMILRSLAAELPERIELIVIAREARRLGGLWTAVADALGLPVDRDRESRGAVERYLAQERAKGNRTALAVDDGDSLPDHWVAALDRMTEPETLTLVVACDGQLAATSRLPAADRLRSRVVTTVRLRALLESECSGYLQALLMAAGAREARFFDDEAVATLHELAGGLPGRIASIAGRALELCFEDGRREVGEEEILTAAEELAAIRPAPTPTLRAVKPSPSSGPPEEDADDSSAPEAEPARHQQPMDACVNESLPAVAAGGATGFRPESVTHDLDGPSRWPSGRGTDGSSIRSEAPSVPSARATETAPGHASTPSRRKVRGRSRSYP